MENMLDMFWMLLCVFTALLKPSKELSSRIEAMLGFHSSVPVQPLVEVLRFSIPKFDYAFEEIQETRSIAQSFVFNNFCV